MPGAKPRRATYALLSNSIVGAEDTTLLDDDYVDRLDAAQLVDTSPSTAAPRARPFRRACLNCGKWFLVAPSSKTRTCSAACSRAHRSRKHLDVSNKWASTDAARTAARHTGNLLLGTPAARNSRRAGPFESNVNAKRWTVLSPSSERYDATNLRLWCELNEQRFAPHHWRAAYAGLRQVSAWLRGKTKRTVTSWRGWSLADLPTKRG